MTRLTASLSAWGGSDFSGVLKRELEALGPDGLSLVKCATVSGYFSDDVAVMILKIDHDKDTIKVNIGVLYTEIEAAYCCPMLPMEHSGMCEMKVTINKNTAQSTFDFVNDW